jgi:hypothetical protein
MRTTMLSLVLWLVVGCSRESLLRSALEDPEERRETMLLTLKVFDEHPEYVDELFLLARDHQATFDRLVLQTALALEDPAFAARVAETLADHPNAIDLSTRALLAESRRRPEIRKALAAAILADGEALNLIVTEHPEIMQQVLLRSFQGNTAPPPAPPAPPSQ